MKLLLFANNRFATLLEHSALSRATAPARDAFEEAWTWIFTDNGTRIEFAGTRTTPAAAGQPARREPLPKQAYCWGKDEFTKCD